MIRPAVATLAVALGALTACQRPGTTTSTTNAPSAVTVAPTTTVPELELDLSVDEATRALLDATFAAGSSASATQPADNGTRVLRSTDESTCPVVGEAAAAPPPGLPGAVHVDLVADDAAGTTLLTCTWYAGGRGATLVTEYRVDDWTALQRLAAEQYQRRIDVGVASGLAINGDVFGVLAGGVWFQITPSGLTEAEVLALADELAAALTAPASAPVSGSATTFAASDGP